MVRFCIQYAHARWARVPWRRVRSRRLTEPPRPCGAGVRVCGRGRISCLRARPKDGARLAAFRSPFGNLRASAYKLVSFPTLAGRGAGVRVCGRGRSLGEFRLCGGDQRAFRSPFGNLRLPLMSLYRFRRWQVAAALSAAVTTAEPIGERPHSQAEPSKRHRLTPNASRSSGGDLGEALLSEKRPPPASPPSCL